MKICPSIASLFLSGILLAAVPLHAIAGADAETRLRDAIHDGDGTLLKMQGASIRVVFADGRLALSKAALLDWIRSDAQAVALYYGGFPVRDLGLLLVPVAGSKVSQGQTFGEGTPVIRVGIGQDADAETLARDWIMVHELVHLAFPLMPRRHHWIEEGIATYVEPIARAQAGLLPAARIWGDLMRDLHQGLPADGDQGLDNTHTWGRTYWGGALFCLLADVKLREQTGNRFGLQDALRAINRDSGGMAHEWPILRALKAGDAATGTQVLTGLYAEMADKPVSPDLPALWSKLGVALVDGRVVFDDKADMAPIRQAITRAR
ncbi:hypothetical protein [Undibacterium sp.]|jgi:hypothetical protein|uniref:hypothetical protein n=1 Tax=Undibacterium sp. TaxID=1914977 RepID=UPI002C7C1F9C|nr:hypothetical protein [Undibacterium sp.]HTD03869.1 hypothetical protein [Undibacterium sp.]